MSLNDFTILKQLGSGSFSEVFRVQRISDQQVYAMKKVKMNSLSKKEKENALNEIRILASVDHKNVIGYKEAFFDEISDSLCIVMEMADGGDLDSKITQAKNLKSFVKEEKIWHIFRELSEGLMALHSHKIVHRDIKCANIFLQSGGGVKLGDMNVSKIAKAGIMQTQTGTPYYCPPEVWQDKPYTSKCDIWSLGCVIYELTALKPPFLGKNMQELFQKVAKGHYPDIPRHFSRDLAKAIGECLNTNPRLRPSAEELLAMPMFQDRQKKEDRAIGQPRSHSQNHEKQPFGGGKDTKIELLQTIHVPRNLKRLNEVLPRAAYDKDQNTMYSEKAPDQKNKILPPNFDPDEAHMQTMAKQQKEESSTKVAKIRARRYREVSKEPPATEHKRKQDNPREAYHSNDPSHRRQSSLIPEPSNEPYPSKKGGNAQVPVVGPPNNNMPQNHRPPNIPSTPLKQNRKQQRPPQGPNNHQSLQNSNNPSQQQLFSEPPPSGKKMQLKIPGEGAMGNAPSGMPRENSHRRKLDLHLREGGDEKSSSALGGRRKLSHQELNQFSSIEQEDANPIDFARNQQKKKLKNYFANNRNLSENRAGHHSRSNQQIPVATEEQIRNLRRKFAENSPASIRSKAGEESARYRLQLQNQNTSLNDDEPSKPLFVQRKISPPKEPPYGLGSGLGGNLGGPLGGALGGHHIQSQNMIPTDELISGGLMPTSYMHQVSQPPAQQQKRQSPSQFPNISQRPSLMDHNVGYVEKANQIMSSGSKLPPTKRTMTSKQKNRPPTGRVIQMEHHGGVPRQGSPRYGYSPRGGEQF